MAVQSTGNDTAAPQTRARGGMPDKSGMDKAVQKARQGQNGGSALFSLPTNAFLAKESGGGPKQDSVLPSRYRPFPNVDIGTPIDIKYPDGTRLHVTEDGNITVTTGKKGSTEVAIAAPALPEDAQMTEIEDKTVANFRDAASQPGAPKSVVVQSNRYEVLDVYNDPDYDRSNPEAVKKAKANIKWAEQHDPAVKKAMQKARNAAIEEVTGRPASRVVGKLSDHVASLPQQGAYMDLLQSNPRAATDVLGMPLDRLQALDPEAAKDARAKYDKALAKATDPNRPGTTELPGGRTRTVVEQDDGTRIITTIDPKGGTITTRTVETDGSSETVTRYTDKPGSKTVSVSASGASTTTTVGPDKTTTVEKSADDKTTSTTTEYTPPRDGVVSVRKDADGNRFTNYTDGRNTFNVPLDNGGTYTGTVQPDGGARAVETRANDVKVITDTDPAEGVLTTTTVYPSGRRTVVTSNDYARTTTWRSPDGAVGGELSKPFQPERSGSVVSWSGPESNTFNVRDDGVVVGSLLGDDNQRETVVSSGTDAGPEASRESSDDVSKKVTQEDGVTRTVWRSSDGEVVRTLEEYDEPVDGIVMSWTGANGDTLSFRDDGGVVRSVVGSDGVRDSAVYGGNEAGRQPLTVLPDA